MKNYIKPVLTQNETQVVQMLAESLAISETTVDGSEALTKENQDWNIWNNER